MTPMSQDGIEAHAARHYAECGAPKGDRLIVIMSCTHNGIHMYVCGYCLNGIFLTVSPSGAAECGCSEVLTEANQRRIDKEAADCSDDVVAMAEGILRDSRKP